MQLSELNELDLKNLASAPTGVKAGVLGLIFVIIVGAGWFLHLSDLWDELTRVENEEQSLRETYTQKRAAARNLDAYRVQLKEAELALATLLKQLPNKSEVDALLTDINQAGLSRGLQFDLFRPGATAFAEFYATLPVTIKVNGGYHEIASFISDVAQMPRIVTVHDMNLLPIKGTQLTMEATLNTYRYLDEAESAAMNPKDAGKGGKK